MQIEYQPGWQQEKHLQDAAAAAGVSVERYAARLLDNAILAEMLQAGLDSPATPLSAADFDRLRDLVRKASGKRQAS